MRENKRVLLVYSIVVIISISVIGKGLLFLYRNPKSESVEVSSDATPTESDSNEKLEQGIANNSDSKGLVDAKDMDKLFEEAKKSLEAASNKRDVDKDSENIYIVNETIKRMYESDKIRKEYIKKYQTSDAKVIVDAITKDVSDYMNKELEK